MDKENYKKQEKVGRKQKNLPKHMNPKEWDND